MASKKAGRAPAKPFPTIRYTITITGKEDLGSRRPMVQRLSTRTRSKQRDKSKSWAADPRAIEEQRAKILERIAYRPAPVPFRTRLLTEQTYPNYVKRSLRLRINPDDEAEAVLYLPKGASRKKPVPALLGIHEHGGQFLLGKEKLCRNSEWPAIFKKYQARCYGGQPPADFFAANGYAVLVIDQIGFGSRALWHQEDEPYLKGQRAFTAAAEQRIRLRMRYEQYMLHRALLASGITEADICLHDNRRSLDFLETIPEIDTDRLGAFGLSVGCLQTHHLAAVDPRIKASVRVCWSGDFGTMIEQDGPRGLSIHFLLPGINAEYGIPELVALSAPSAVLILNGTRDPLYPFGAQEKTRREVRRLTAFQGRGKTVRWQYFDGHHCFHPAEQQQALAFFQEFL